MYGPVMNCLHFIISVSSLILGVIAMFKMLLSIHTMTIVTFNLHFCHVHL